MQKSLLPQGAKEDSVILIDLDKDDAKKRRQRISKLMAEVEND